MKSNIMGRAWVSGDDDKLDLVICSVSAYSWIKNALFTADWEYSYVNTSELFIGAPEGIANACKIKKKIHFQ